MLRTDGKKRIGSTPQRDELLQRLSTRYKLSQQQVESLDRTALMRLADAFDFLSNNLPPDSFTER